jgi:hypothetical protein
MPSVETPAKGRSLLRNIKTIWARVQVAASMPLAVPNAIAGDAAPRNYRGSGQRVPARQRLQAMVNVSIPQGGSGRQVSHY